MIEEDDKIIKIPGIEKMIGIHIMKPAGTAIKLEFHCLENGQAMDKYKKLTVVC